MDWFPWLKRLAAPFAGGPPMPETPFVAIGDVHGRLDLLAPRLDRLLAGPDHVVLLGDYVDRGEESAGVLRLLEGLERQGRVTCLLGNHEEMMLGFLDEPERRGPLWLHNGGLQTLASYGIGGVTARPHPEALLRARDGLAEAMGGTRDWLARLPRTWRSGNVAAVHAGADPRKSLEEQDPKVLIWGHPDFGRVARTDGIWVVHGHVIVDAPLIGEGRAAIDTGAFATGRLTALRVERGGMEVLA